MKIGITGSRYGMTEKQTIVLGHMFQAFEGLFDPVIIGHGDCVGVDAQAHDLAVSLGYRTEVFPPLEEISRAWKQGDILHDPEGYLKRDRAIVEWCDVLFGLPNKDTEIFRSGTWYTIRYGLKEQERRSMEIEEREIEMDVCVIQPAGLMISNSEIKDLLLSGKWGENGGPS